MVRWMLAAFVASLPFVACSSSSENKSAPPCKAGETRNCIGPGQCAGAQSCETNGTWTTCDCGSAGTGGVGGSSGTSGASAGGMGGSGGSSGSGGVTGGAAGTGGVPDSGPGGSGGVVSDAAPDATDFCAEPPSVSSCKACCESEWPYQTAGFDAAFWTCACSYGCTQCPCSGGPGTLSAACNTCLGANTIDLCIASTCPSGNCEQAGICFDTCYTPPPVSDS